MTHPNSKTRILLVEDNEDQSFLMALLLKQIGNFEIVVAIDGLDGEVKCEALHPDLVIMDLLMPTMGGVESTRRIRKKFPDLPILVLTGSVTPENANAAREAGCSEFLAKPIPLDGLREVICRYLPCPDAT